ncbi:uncharacterized protein [Aristolochia californica]|uniref:uncharacterized protein isoform X2 n=1 Tax=Aristolochia californica TaxID=171875 RepID=UPI0035D8C077
MERIWFNSASNFAVCHANLLQSVAIDPENVITAISFGPAPNAVFPTHNLRLLLLVILESLPLLVGFPSFQTRNMRLTCSGTNMDPEIGFDFPCASVTIDSILRFGVAGCGWGFFTGQHEADKKGIAGRSKASFVIKSVGKYGLQCGLFAGMFSATRCGIQRYRMEKDWELLLELLWQQGPVAGPKSLARPC